MALQGSSTPRAATPHSWIPYVRDRARPDAVARACHRNWIDPHCVSPDVEDTSVDAAARALRRGSTGSSKPS